MTAATLTWDRLDALTAQDSCSRLAGAVREMAERGSRVFQKICERYALDCSLSQVKELALLDGKILRCKNRARAYLADRQHERILRLYDYIHRMVGVLSDESTVNQKVLLPVAVTFTEQLLQAVDGIEKAYARGDRSLQNVRIIEREGIRIFNAVREVAVQSQSFNTHIVSSEESATNIVHSPTRHTAFYDKLRTQRGPTQSVLYSQAERLGPEQGGKFFLAVEDVFLAAIDMLRNLKQEGFSIDMNAFPGRAARPEYYGLQVPPGYSAFDSKEKPGDLPPIDPLTKVAAHRRHPNED